MKRRSINCSDLKEIPPGYEEAVDTVMDHLLVILAGVGLKYSMPVQCVLDGLLSCFANLAVREIGQKRTIEMLRKLEGVIPDLLALDDAKMAGSA